MKSSQIDINTVQLAIAQKKLNAGSRKKKNSQKFGNPNRGWVMLLNQIYLIKLTFVHGRRWKNS